MGASLTIKSTIDVSHLVKQSKNYFWLAQRTAANAMLDWMANGSMNSPKKPPIRTGVLASSGSVFYKSKYLGSTKDVRTSDAKEPAFPNKHHTGEGVTWGFNTDYATAMHEDKNLSPGPFSIRDSNMHPGNQWLMEHLQKDKNSYTELVAKFIKNKLDSKGK